MISGISGARVKGFLQDRGYVDINYASKRTIGDFRRPRRQDGDVLGVVYTRVLFYWIMRVRFGDAGR